MSSSTRGCRPHLTGEGTGVWENPMQSTRHEKPQGANGLPCPRGLLQVGGSPSSPDPWAQAGGGGPRTLLGAGMEAFREEMLPPGPSRGWGRPGRVGALGKMPE